MLMGMSEVITSKVMFLNIRIKSYAKYAQFSIYVLWPLNLGVRSIMYYASNDTLVFTLLLCYTLNRILNIYMRIDLASVDLEHDYLSISCLSCRCTAGVEESMGG